MERSARADAQSQRSRASKAPSETVKKSARAADAESETASQIALKQFEKEKEERR